MENELKLIDVNFNSRGIIVNDKMQTNVDYVYAIGDVTGRYELVHVASKQVEVAADNIMGIEISIDSHFARVLGYPEIAFVGQVSGKRIGASPQTASA
jgi:dihydrolipoamide dehydrogenase